MTIFAQTCSAQGCGGPAKVAQGIWTVHCQKEIMRASSLIITHSYAGCAVGAGQ